MNRINIFKLLWFSFSVFTVVFFDFSLGSSNNSILNLSHVIDNDRLILAWEPVSESNTIEIKIYNYLSGEFVSLSTVPMEQKQYAVRLNCDFINNFRDGIHVNGSEFTFSLQPLDKLGSVSIYSLNILFDDNECKFDTDSFSTLNETSESDLKVESSFIDNSFSSKKYVKGDWYDEGNQQDILDNGYRRELYNAYKFAYVYGLTDAISIGTANMYGDITRAALAKMMASFAINILGLNPDTSKDCYFSDVTEDLNRKYNYGITTACQLGIMGVGINKFKPHDNVLRAEFATVLSRLVFGQKDGIPYYEPHISQLRFNSILTDINPFKIEKRGNVLLMLMRTALNVVSEITDYKVAENEESKISFHLNKFDLQVLMGIVDAVDPNLEDYVKFIISNDEGTGLFISDVGADLSRAHFCHAIMEGNDKVYLYWDMVPYSTQFDVKLYRYNHWVKIDTVSMFREKAQYEIEGNKMMFSFVPKNSQGNEYRYDIDTQNYGTNCFHNKWEMPDEVLIAKYNLGRVTDVLGILIPQINAKDDKTRNKVLELLGAYKNSSDEFTKNIGIYLEHLLKNS